MKQWRESGVQATSQVGHKVFGSTFSTNFKKETLLDLWRWPGFLSHVIKKKVFAKRKRVRFRDTSSVH
jgi:hypothetical protein